MNNSYYVTDGVANNAQPRNSDISVYFGDQHQQQLHNQYPIHQQPISISSLDNVDNSDSNPDRYATPNNMHGHCIIVNGLFRSNNQQLKKRSIECANMLKDRFSSLNYDADYSDEFSCNKLKSLLTAMARLNHQDHDSFICCILAKGNEKAIFDEDDREIKIEDLYSYFTPKDCNSLSGKPKFFFIQTFEDQSMLTDSEPEQLVDRRDNHFNNANTLPECSDVLVSYCSYSARSLRQNWPTYIQILCDVLRDCANNYDLITMLTEVNHRSTNLGRDSGIQNNDIPYYTTMLRQPFHFQNKDIP